MNHLSTDEVVDLVVHAVAILAQLANELGPQYWDLKPRPKKNSLPRTVVIAIAGSDEEIEAAINIVETIRKQQMQKAKVDDDRY